MANSSGYHEPLEDLSEETRDFHRALTSLQEELEAVDWYRQRASATSDTSLRDILLHNMGEEIEHAAMLLEWLRRREPTFDKQLRGYLFTEEPITEVEETLEKAELEGANAETDATPVQPNLTVGPLKGEQE